MDTGAARAEDVAEAIDVAAVETPRAEAAVEDTVEAPRAEAPQAEAAVEAQRAAAAVQAPKTETETPRAEVVVEAPNAGDVAEAPAVEAPEADAAVGAQRVDAMAEAPVAQAVNQAPATRRRLEASRARSEAAREIQDSRPGVKNTIQMMKLDKAIRERELVKLKEEINFNKGYLSAYCVIKSDYRDALHVRRMRARKVVAASLAVSLSSLAAGFRLYTNSAFRDALPWTIGIFATSLAFSIIFSKDVWLSFRDPSKMKTIEASISDTEKILDFLPEELDPDVILPHTSLPEITFPVHLSSNGADARLRRRIVSV